MKAVVLLSGGLDSTTALFQAVHDGAKEILAVNASYGSRHMDAEYESFVKVVNYVRGLVPITPKVVTMPDIFRGGHSALMGDIDVPTEEYNDVETEGESPTVVPFRNANLISAAVTLAEVENYSKVYAGMHASDHTKWAYPDCSPEFLGAMANAIWVGTLGRVRLVFPFVWMTKAEVVTRGALLNVPFHLTWSCYLGGRVHCGICPTCRERIAAFAEALYRDPVEYGIATPEFDALPRYNVLH
jgi:7-cyano-7-deazaguanine synthase